MEEYTTQEMLENWFDSLTKKEVVRLWNGYCEHTGKGGDPKLYKVYEMVDYVIDEMFPEAHMLAEKIIDTHWNYCDDWWHYKSNRSLESLESPMMRLMSLNLKIGHATLTIMRLCSN